MCINITIKSDREINSDECVKMHFDYSNYLTLKELSEVLDFVNKAINDVNRGNGIKNNVQIGQEYASKVSGVDAGSIVVDILINLVQPVALSILASYIYERLRKLREKGKSAKKNSMSQEQIQIIVDVILSPLEHHQFTT